MNIYFKKETKQNEIDVYVACDCDHPAHAVKLKKFDNEEYLYISFITEPKTFLDKLKFAWSIIFSGGLEMDEIVLDQKTWKELGNVLMTVETTNGNGESS